MPDSPFNNQRIVLVGGTGMLGRAWRELLSHHGIGYDAPPRGELDLTAPRSIHEAITPGTAAVINCGAFTDVDGCEARPTEAILANAVGPGNLAQRCAAIGGLLVHYSTDYVFSGRASEPYAASAPRDPVNVYGQSKALGEARVEEAGGEHLIIRTSWLYAPWGRNFVRTMARLCQEKPALNVVDDQRGRPTSAEHLARATLELIGHRTRGIHHVTDGGECTWCELTRQIAARLNPDCAVSPCTTEAFPRPARRPAYSVLDVSDTERVIGAMPHWRDNLASVLDRLEEA
ncbi:MAG: dTDP-4-dehydrorhamnose reductase [Phycisphaeraceae bacterium]